VPGALSGAPSPASSPSSFPRVRCFVAVWPPADVLGALAALPRPDVQLLRWSTQDQWHVTLRFFGELPEGDLARAARVLTKVARSTACPLRANGGPATRFLGPGLVVWPVAGLEELARAVERASRRLGKPVPRRPFAGHLTIARARAGADLRQQMELLAPLSRSWEVSSFSLVQSHLHPDGARYEDVEVFEIGTRRTSA
jgi:2'-5' RNA ligase